MCKNVSPEYCEPRPEYMAYRGKGGEGKDEKNESQREYISNILVDMCTVGATKA
jgi:hypothetical protein